jgi:hypothetical protein
MKPWHNIYDGQQERDEMHIASLPWYLRAFIRLTYLFWPPSYK